MSQPRQFAALGDLLPSPDNHNPLPTPTRTTLTRPQQPPTTPAVITEPNQSFGSEKSTKRVRNEQNMNHAGVGFAEMDQVLRDEDRLAKSAQNNPLPRRSAPSHQSTAQNGRIIGGGIMNGYNDREAMEFFTRFLVDLKTKEIETFRAAQNTPQNAQNDHNDHNTTASLNSIHDPQLTPQYQLSSAFSHPTEVVGAILTERNMRQQEKILHLRSIVDELNTRTTLISQSITALGPLLNDPSVGGVEDITPNRLLEIVGIGGSTLQDHDGNNQEVIGNAYKEGDGVVDNNNNNNKITTPHNNTTRIDFVPITTPLLDNESNQDTSMGPDSPAVASKWDNITMSDSPQPQPQHWYSVLIFE